MTSEEFQAKMDQLHYEMKDFADKIRRDSARTTLQMIGLAVLMVALVFAELWLARHHLS